MLKVYITDLSAYNKGFLVGEWVSLPLDKEELDSKIKEILLRGEVEANIGYKETHEEYFITDFEFDSFEFDKVSEYSNVYELNETAEKLSDFSEDDLKRISFLISEVGLNLDDALDRYEDVYIYENSTLEDVVEESLEQSYDLSSLPDIIRNNIDYSSIARDWDISGEFWAIDGDIYNFVN